LPLFLCDPHVTPSFIVRLSTSLGLDEPTRKRGAPAAQGAAARTQPLASAPPASAAEQREERQALRDEVILMGKALRKLHGFKLLVLDTEVGYLSTGMARELAAASGGRYIYIPMATRAGVTQVAQQALDSTRGAKPAVRWRDTGAGVLEYTKRAAA
jgi:hypothetical protein